MKKVLSIGRMEPSKRPIDFIEIAREVIQLSKEEVSFYWIGEGSLLEMCKKMTALEANIQFLGFVAEAKKKWFLENCDVYISTSESEGFNLTIGEALLFKKSVVAYALPVYREIYDNFVHLVPLNARSRFVLKIVQFLDNPPKEMTEKACTFVKENYSPETIRRRLLRIFHDLLSENN